MSTRKQVRHAATCALDPWQRIKLQAFGEMAQRIASGSVDKHEAKAWAKIYPDVAYTYEEEGFRAACLVAFGK